MNVSKSNQNSKIMKTKIFSLVIITALFSTLYSNAQSTPEPPTPPSTTNYSSSSSSHSIIVEDDNNDQNSSVSISISDDSYKFRARYDSVKNEGVKAILLKQLGNNQLKISGNSYLWTNEKGGEDIFECKLNKGNLKIFVDKASVSDSFYNKIVELGKDLKYYISGSSREKEEAKNAEEAKRELERAERELVRAKRELERAERKAKEAREN